MRDGLEVRIGIYTLPYTKSISNKDLPYCSREYIQYSVIAYMGKRMDVYVYIWLIYFSVHLKLTQLCKSPILQLHTHSHTHQFLQFVV